MDKPNAALCKEVSSLNIENFCINFDVKISRE